MDPVALKHAQAPLPLHALLYTLYVGFVVIVDPIDLQTSCLGQHPRGGYLHSAPRGHLGRPSPPPRPIRPLAAAADAPLCARPLQRRVPGILPHQLEPPNSPLP
eukprot:1017625-Pyramimonas_sp.AAC.1